MAGTPEGPIDEWPLDEARELDAILGVRSESDVGPPRRSLDSQIYVCVSGDAQSASWSMGLEEDVSALAQAFIAGGGALAEEITRLLPRSSDRPTASEQHEDVDVALHGLMLDSRGEEELRDLIRMLVEARIADQSSRS
jgi:hypothetical protein